MGLLDLFTKREPKRHSGYLSVQLDCGHEKALGIENLQAIAEGRRMVICNSCGEARWPDTFKLTVVEET